mmetsp:Transcript_26324/g.40777  ORF Transcript_26324/g.40777 Transcript_26324/m.40777 type:complete len:315 (-) Transcript_26324:64-1008(-)
MMAHRLQPTIHRATSTINSRYTGTIGCRRVFSSPADADDGDDVPKADPRQLVHTLYNPTIRMSPLGVSKSILPGGLIEKVNEKTGDRTFLEVERAMGHFWMLGDLRKNGGKPIIANESLIPVSYAQVFPRLEGLVSLSGKENVNLPDFLCQDAGYRLSSACTLVAISFKQFGFEKLKGWIEPFETAVCHGIGPDSRAGRAKVVQISIIEGGLYKMFSGLFIQSWKSSTPEELHENTLLHFGSEDDTKSFRENIRMHNTLTGYVALVDGLGRVRWMGSGEASDDEVATLIDCARELTPTKSIRPRKSTARTPQSK